MLALILEKLLQRMVAVHTLYSTAIRHKSSMILLNDSPVNDASDTCLNFFNESWVCFDDVKVHLAVNMTIEPNEEIMLNGCQHETQWHLHDITQHTAGPPFKYGYEDARQGSSVPIYVVDTWIDVNHEEFEGRVDMGARFASGESNGHGTHVVGLIASRSYGVNKKAQVVGVQVLDDNGFGSWQT